MRSHDTTRIDKLTLAILGLSCNPSLLPGTPKERAISSCVPAEILIRLHEHGFIESLDFESKSLTLSPRGLTTAKELGARYFEVAPSSTAPSASATKSVFNSSSKTIDPRDLPESLREVLAEHTAGPTTGVFTDGGARPNPGRGGWGVVIVQDNQIVAHRCGHHPETTNNRMELTALIEAYKLLPEDAEINIYSDSNLCVQTVNEWAANWKKRGWRKKDGEIKNLELVQELYELALAHPKAKLQWIKAHNGWRWNEYVDVLASAWDRGEKIGAFG
jgi:ribonuclease HI